MAVGIDIGSNSLRMIQIDCTTLKKKHSFERVVRTAEELESTGRISEAAQQRIIEALLEIKEIIADDRYKAVATAAFRKAKNAKEVCKTIFDQTGIQVEIIDTAQESLYSVKGVEYGLQLRKIPSQKFLMVDIGGGSTEIILKNKRDLIFESFGIGILTTIQKYHTKEEILFGIKKKMQEVKLFLHDIFEHFGKPKIFVGTGGTPTTVAALKAGMSYETFDAEKISGTAIEIKDIEEAYKRLIKLPPKERAKLVGTGREDAIIAGLVILEEIMKQVGLRSMIVSDEGVREGVALWLCEMKR
ncbi:MULTISPECIES: phosphatase [unclassified Nitratiruptor]|uniref:Ppx/GppA phosphatase family protein n=1 Tax=unclassified Nitratiruptor TaxID=2624044 RepID=UPI001915B1BF|nr:MULTISPECIES: phosphatase [unclassified Nitratiruptor]BCD60471.1 exopolyphosphatase / guanosine-5'-triphosphate,3'-diphosphate pyrophosphatase [Nitratiruptor sp. YY08-10]BCD64040.1 exopolyphosphatase / guanosine-5'-triphosphate,3'-diphosphate pyrophosphatase [Nitratiruptor sp. YY08-14]